MAITFALCGRAKLICLPLQLVRWSPTKLPPVVGRGNTIKVELWILFGIVYANFADMTPLYIIFFSLQLEPVQVSGSQWGQPVASMGFFSINSRACSTLLDCKWGRTHTVSLATSIAPGHGANTSITMEVAYRWLDCGCSSDVEPVVITKDQLFVLTQLDRPLSQALSAFLASSGAAWLLLYTFSSSQSWCQLCWFRHADRKCVIFDYLVPRGAVGPTHTSTQGAHVDFLWEIAQWVA